MSFTPGYKARIVIGDFSYSAKLSDFSLPLAVEQLDVTTFADDGVKRFIPGLQSSTASASGFLDADGAADSAVWTTNTPLTYAPFGLALGSKVELVDSLRGTFQVESPVGGVVSFSLAATTDGPLDFGISLHDLTAETADANGSSHDGAASSSGGGIGQLHVTAFSGLSQAVVKVQDSADDSNWDDLVTFSTVSGVTSERSAVTGTVERYLRASLDVTGTGSITFQLSFARR